ncbi:MAG: 2TM domain-containing protein [Cyanobacteria bacterium P01_E01_bin.6]
MPKLYSHEEVQEILNLAIARQTDAGELTYHQLLEIADELGLSAHDIQQAEDDWRSLDTEVKDRQEFCRYRQIQFRQHAFKYLIVNGFIHVIALLGLSLAGQPLTLLPGPLIFSLIWGMFLSLDGWSSIQTEGSRFDRRYQKWRRTILLRRSVNNLVNRGSKAVGSLIGRWFEAM